MFGIDQISWGQFSGFILVVLLLWYLGVVARALLDEQNRNRQSFFEDGFSTPVQQETATPISVRSGDYPAKLLPLRLSADVPLPVSLYEETGMDEGYVLECFTERDHPHLPKIMEQVQFQQ